MKTSIKAVIIALGMTGVVAAAGAASADTPWQAHHPRREEVNQRLDRQYHRITEERREGELTRAQVRDIRGEDRGIRDQERFDASHDGGHITRAEQRRLNREENGVSRQIGR